MFWGLIKPNDRFVQERHERYFHDFPGLFRILLISRQWPFLILSGFPWWWKEIVGSGIGLGVSDFIIPFQYTSSWYVLIPILIQFNLISVHLITYQVQYMSIFLKDKSLSIKTVNYSKNPVSWYNIFLWLTFFIYFFTHNNITSTQNKQNKTTDTYSMF